MDTAPIKILIADDHEIVRQGVRNLVEAESDMTVCAEATLGRDAVKLAESLQPDVAVLDLCMPELNGIETTKQMLRVSPQTRVLIFTMHEAEQLVREVFESGAHGYVLKSDAGRHLLSAIRTVAAGSHFFSSRLSEVIFDGFLNRGESRPGLATPGLGKPSSREREIIQLLAEGKSNKEVASTLGISVKTAETHRASIMRKLNLRSVSDLVRYAIRNHIIEA